MLKLKTKAFQIKRIRKRETTVTTNASTQLRALPPRRSTRNVKAICDFVLKAYAEARAANHKSKYLAASSDQARERWNI
jgi:hypothetical protein